MLDQSLRVPKQRVLMPLAKKLNVSPSWFTLAGLVVGLAAVTLLALGESKWALGLWALNRIIDGLDGEIARMHNRQSDLGGYFDIMADFVIYAALPVAVVIANPSFTAWLALSVLLVSFYINAGSWMYLSSILEKRNQGAKSKLERTSITMPAGLIEGTETIVFFSLFLLLPQFAVLLFWLMTILIVFTIFQRVFWAAKVL